MLTYIFLAILIVLGFFNLLKMKKMGKGFNGPPVIPFFGNAYLFIGTSEKAFITLERFWQNYGPTYSLFIGNNFFVVVTHPNDVEAILSSYQFLEKSNDYEFMKPWLGTGLLTSSSDKWRKHRKVITPAFHFNILERYIKVFDLQADILTKKLEKYTDNEYFDVFPLITLCALDVMCETSMGVNIGAQSNSESEYVKAVKEMCRITSMRQVNPLKRLDFLFRFCRDYWVQKKSLNILHGFTDKMIKERRDILQSNNENLLSYTTEDDQATGTKKKLAFLDILLLSTIDGKPLPDIDIRNEVDTFLFEGHDTTTSGISFALHLIATNPRVQNKLLDEQKSIFGDDFNRPVTYKDLQDMKYLELAIKETLRLYPSVPIIARKVYEATKVNDMVIPAESTVVVMVYNMSRNPEIFPEPTKFIPERFSPDETNKRSPFASVFFSAGPRNCIGQKFAILEMKSIISKILRKYELFGSDEKFSLTAELILKSTSGIKIRISKRKCQ